MQHLAAEDPVLVCETSILKHFHLRNHCNQSNLGKTDQGDSPLGLLQTTIDYGDYD